VALETDNSPGTQVKIAGPYIQGGKNMSVSETENTALAEELPIELVAEIGRLQLSGKQALELGPGDVVTLDRPVTAGVELRVGNRLIAKGELVDVEGEAGIRLTEVYD
ncbi:MAG: FliM/FliN family flagellar motor C-terminal domain-containing protein, partial [Pseudomonadota bacterium]